MDGALEEQLLLKSGAYTRELRLKPESARGKVHRMGWIWALLTYRRRVLPKDAQVHASVRTRVEEDKAYAKRVPQTVAWVDGEWLTARG